MRVLAQGLSFPEGPAFSPDGALWFVEYRGAGLACWRDGELTRHATGGAPNGSTFDTQGRLWFCDAERGAICRWAGGTVEVVCGQAGGEPLNRPNDLVFDDAGNLLFTCPGNSRTEPTGYVCCLSPQGIADRIADGLYFPNGLALDGNRLVVAETYRHRLWHGPWDSTARAWRQPTVFAHAGGPIGPDGMAFAADGLLFVAVYGQQAVRVFNTAGSLVRELRTPGHNPTNVAFDPTGALGFVITEAERGELLSVPLQEAFA